MRSRDQFREWMKGCSCADHDKPWECSECTLGMLEAVNRSMDEEEAEEQIAKMEGATAMLGGMGLIGALRKRFGAKIDEAVRSELGDVAIARDNAETANHGLRVELHMAQQLLAGANASIVLLARGAGQTKSQHLSEMAEAQLELARLRAEIADLHRARR